MSKHEYTIIAAQILLFHNELTILHTQQRNDVKVCTNTSKRGVSLCFPMYVCNLWGVPITKKFISRRMKPDVYIQLILDNSGITTIFWINSMQLFSLVLLFAWPQNRFESNLAEMFIGWSYTRFVFLALIGNPTWLPGPIMCSDWSKF